MRISILPVVLGVLVCWACGPSVSATSPRSIVVSGEDAKLAAGDTFEVRVYGEKELSGNYRVAQDGTIDFPLVGRIPVSGKEATEVADEIKSRLRNSRILLDPQVSVMVAAYGSKRISVMGAVSKPGTFPMTSGLTVIEAISLAGGFTSLAAENDTLVTRRREGKLQRFLVPVGQVAEGRAEDFTLQAGDLIFVPERLF